MKVKVKKEEEQIIFDSEERSIITAAEENFRRLSQHEKILIESILENNIKYCDINNPNPQFPSLIGKAFETALNPQAAAFLLNLIINPQHIKINLDDLTKEGLISENTSKFISELAAKYGESLHTIMINLERPHDWIRLQSDVLISGTIIKLQSKIFRADGDVFQFTSNLEDSITFIEHFMRRTLETIKTMDKEKILELDEVKIDSIEKQIDDFKIFHQSVKQEIEEFEHTEEIPINNPRE